MVCKLKSVLCIFKHNVSKKPVKHDCSSFAGQYFPPCVLGFFVLMQMPAVAAAVVVVVAAVAVAAVQLAVVSGMGVAHFLGQSMLSLLCSGLQSSYLKAINKQVGIKCEIKH